MLLDVLVLLASLVILGFSANYMVGSGVRIARHFKLSEAFIGLTLIAWGTSAPELAVSVVAAINGHGDLSVGNVIGSNIFNLGFILGLVALVCAQAIEKKMVYRDGIVLLVATLLVLFFVWDFKVSFFEGFILLMLLLAYSVYLFATKDVVVDEEFADSATKAAKYDRFRDIFIFVASLAILIKSSDYTVESAVNIAKVFGVSDWAIGATIIAAGTSLPEMATSIVATIKGKFGLAVGNVIGSDIFNVLGIIGVSAVIRPIQLTGKHSVLGFPDFIFSQIMLVATLVLILIFMRTKWTISRLEGGFLLAIATARMIFEIYIGS